jgi:hypothetical protein
VELNPPKDPHTKRSQGAFAEDEKGRVYAVHRGGIRGRKKGGKSFLAWYPAALRRDMREGTRTTPVIVVGPLGNPGFLKGVNGFVGLARAYRQGVPSAAADETNACALMYTPEHTGTSKYTKTEGEIQIEWRHGEVVADLYKQLKKLGAKPGKDQQRDLVAVDAAGRELLFEVKAARDTQSLYTAVGQLAWHATPGTKRVAVLPKNTSAKALARLGELGITCLEYSLKGGDAHVRGVQELFRAE